MNADQPAHGGLRLAARLLASGGCGTSLLLAVLFLAPASSVTADYQDTCESAETSWQRADADCQYRLSAHQHTDQMAHSGRASEYLQLAAGPGTYIHLKHEIPRSRVIAEWLPSVWVKSDRAGLQFMARVVLPRSADPRTGEPLRAFLRGDIYDRVGTWQQLAIRQADQLLSRQVRVLRSQFGSEVETREAYVDLVVLNVYGGTGVTNVWIDDLEVTGDVTDVKLASQARPAEPAGSSVVAADNPANPEPPRHRDGARLQGSVLLVDGRPFFPRAIEHNGESLEWLKSLGFNTIQLNAPATDIQLREAERVGLWLVAPPPNSGEISGAHEPVLAWGLGNRLREDRLELTRQWSGQLRRSDPRPERPLICGADERLWGFSRLANLLLVPRVPLGGGMSLASYGRWFKDRPGLTRPGTPLWATIPTEPEAVVVEQWSAFGLELPVCLAAEPDQMRLATYQAVASGARGLLFSSRTPLDRPDADAQLRTRALQRLNLELQFLEPWVAGGATASEIDAGSAQVRIGMLQTERAQLLLILDQSAGQQYTVAPPAERSLTLVVPSVANSPQVLRVTAAGLQTLTHRRVAGGVRFTVDEPSLVSLVAITQDPPVLNHLGRVLNGSKSQLAKVQYDLAAAEWQLVQQVHSRLVGEVQEKTPLTEALRQAQSNLRHCELLLGANDQASAALCAERTVHWLSQIRRFHWQQVAQVFPASVASPYAVAFPALPLHWVMAARLQNVAPWSINALPAGDFENLDHLRGTGWRNDSLAGGPARSAVELSTEAPHGGQAALRLQAWPAEGQDPPTALESPPVQIRSAPVRVQVGQLVRLHGFVRVPQRIAASQDGLMIYDTLAGPALADRIPVTEGWREFVLYRAAPYGGDVALVFALTGLGEAYVDDVSITLRDPIGEHSPRQRLDQARRLPPVSDTLR